LVLSITLEDIASSTTIDNGTRLKKFNLGATRLERGTITLSSLALSLKKSRLERS
jgi:hypothetical protein